MPRHLLKALAAQVAGFLIIYSLGHSESLPAMTLIQLALIQGVVAASASAILLCPKWWAFIHLVFCPALALAIQTGIPPWVYGLAFAVLALTYWSSFRTQVPLYLSNKHTAHRMLAYLGNPAELKLLDIGSGTGGLLRRIARLRPAWDVRGIESAPAPFWISRWLARREARLTFHRADLWKMPLGDFDVVYAFLSPVPMPGIWRKAITEMKPGSLLISNSFEIPGIQPFETLLVDDSRHTRLFCYRIPAKHPIRRKNGSIPEFVPGPTAA
ncbi:class I SAM-dependent methyltransferase [Uliginosibacterium paludis]|uniref:Class I SAM-dependent methyltransferase n=1 Tax=Uliginosibacterium paludis TaxID=1615952 RepID=A0ABV2CQY5_9RHOO